MAAQGGVDEQETTNKEGTDEIAASLEAFIDGRFMTILMTFVTIFALFGDDVRLAGFYKPSDPYFYALFLISLLLFAFELIINSITKENYKWSFFFWLDIIATLSLVPDIPWVVDPIKEVLGISTDGGAGEAARAGKASRAGARAGRIVRLVRLIRLIRIVKLYKYCTKASDEDQEEKLKEQARAALNAKQAALKRVEASRLGKFLSEMTTRKVIVGVLLMLFILPVLQVSEEDNAKFYGLRELFWFGRSNCTAEAVDDSLGTSAEISAGYNYQSDVSSKGLAALDRLCIDADAQGWLTTDGWERLLYHYTQVTAKSTDGDLLAGLLWLRVPDYRQGGRMTDIDRVVATVYERDGDSETRTWDPTDEERKCRRGSKRHDEWECRGVDPNDCPCRDAELETVSYSPFFCEKAHNCKALTAYARFNTRIKSTNEALWNMAQTVFICFLLGTLAMLFSKDTQALVIAPIENMVNIIKQLADDPLKKPEVVSIDEYDDDSSKKKRKKKKGPQLETSMLEQTIIKIGGLLQVGFGEAGAEVIGNNMSSGDGELNIMIPGRRIQAIFGFCDIRRFTDATEALEEDVMVFVNLVGRITHHCTHRWSGAANKNVGDAFLFTWKIGNTNDTQARDGSLAMKAAESANKALVAFLKAIVEIRRSSEVLAFETDARMVERFGKGHRLRIGYGLHVGWAIEGAIGSDFKIDASYLSPHVSLTEKLQEATKVYQTPLIMSEQFYNMLSLKAKERTRKLDVVTVRFAFHEPTGIFAYDVTDDVVPRKDTSSCLGEIHKPEELAELPEDHLSGPGVEYMFVFDKDLTTLQERIPEQLFYEHRAALCQYIEGNWKDAVKGFTKCMELWENDGPSRALLEFMSRTNNTAPEGWAGHRALELLESSWEVVGKGGPPPSVAQTSDDDGASGSSPMTAAESRKKEKDREGGGKKARDQKRGSTGVGSPKREGRRASVSQWPR
ncbi:unnamed protein product [Vitrella brassicaformis CCMP3155]|uniref:Guanylate cyclase domain-containing protein n=2 Tax=Vitrella brassicaformis TaxID=1169539 RepID=A0A0G4EI22_VITBC|nr:unnamed protein product [Vitrella brassicaformis CCMP3155]|eukprot:CEL96628.1 unnamed protein product [Vitrella brassicaformis CCMP3155]